MSELLAEVIRELSANGRVETRVTIRKRDWADCQPPKVVNALSSPTNSCTVRHILGGRFRRRRSARLDDLPAPPSSNFVRSLTAGQPDRTRAPKGARLSGPCPACPVGPAAALDSSERTGQCPLCPTCPFCPVTPVPRSAQGAKATPHHFFPCAGRAVARTARGAKEINTV
jgi:hypothetical protein